VPPFDDHGADRALGSRLHVRILATTGPSDLAAVKAAVPHSKEPDLVSCTHNITKRTRTNVANNAYRITWSDLQSRSIPFELTVINRVVYPELDTRRHSTSGLICVKDERCP